MTNRRFFFHFAAYALVACSMQGRPMAAQEVHHPHIQIKIVPSGNAERQNAESSQAKGAQKPEPRLYALQGVFAQTYPTIGANTDGSDVWPCTGDSSNTGPNPDCPTIGDPSIVFPSTATAVGNPAFVWQLKNTPGSGNGHGCNALINGTGHLGSPYFPCGQVETWYEDDTGDTTDELLYSMAVTQGTKTLADTGTVDIGPNASSVTNPPSDLLIYNPINLGYGPGDGPSTGVNNGDCNSDYNYPLAAAENPGVEYLAPADKTCVEPVPGKATITVKTSLGAPVYREVVGFGCTSKGVASPCYKVEWVKKHEIVQTWDIWLE